MQKFTWNYLPSMLLCLHMFAISCGDTAKPPAGLETLLGSKWEGVFSPSSSPDQMKKSVKVALNFHKNETFQLLQTENLTSTVSGLFKDMPQHRNLIFEIQKSSFETFGLAGTSRDFDYSLEGNELELTGSEGKYSLLRKDDIQADDNENQSGLDGTWLCETSDNASWQLNVSEASFRGHKSQKDRPTVFFEGEVGDRASNDRLEMATLKIQSSNFPAIVGSFLRISLKQGNDVLFVKEVDESGDQITNTQALECQKQD